MADSDGLENRCPRKGTVGSNPTLSAKQNSFDPERDDMQRVERTVAVYTDAFECIVGVPAGSLTLVDDQTLKEWFISPRENEVEMKS